MSPSRKPAGLYRVEPRVVGVIGRQYDRTIVLWLSQELTYVDSVCRGNLVLLLGAKKVNNAGQNDAYLHFVVCLNSLIRGVIWAYHDELVLCRSL